MHAHTCVCMHVHTCTETCTHMHMHTRTHALHAHEYTCTYSAHTQCTCTHVQACTHICACVCTRMSTHIQKRARMHTHAHTNTCTAHTCTHLHIQCTRMHTRTHRSRACHRREGTQEARGESRSPPWLCGQPFLLSTPSTEFSNTRRTFCSRPCAHAGREAARGERSACWVTPWAHGTRSRAGRTLSAPPFCSAGLKPRCYKGLFYVWLLKLFSQATDTGI